MLFLYCFYAVCFYAVLILPFHCSSTDLGLLYAQVYRHGYNSMATIGRDLFGELMAAVEAAGLRKGVFYEIEDYFNFGCSYQVNATGSPLAGRRCPWGGSDEVSFQFSES